MEYSWLFPDGTIITSEAIEYEDIGLWLEAYDDMPDKTLEFFNSISFLEPEIENALGREGNLLEFNFKINFKDGDVTYCFVQFGEGIEAARSITSSGLVDEVMLLGWINSIDQQGPVVSN